MKVEDGGFISRITTEDMFRDRDKIRGVWKPEKMNTAQLCRPKRREIASQERHQTKRRQPQ